MGDLHEKPKIQEYREILWQCSGPYGPTHEGCPKCLDGSYPSQRYKIWCKCACHEMNIKETK